MLLIVMDLILILLLDMIVMIQLGIVNRLLVIIIKMRFFSSSRFDWGNASGTIELPVVERLQGL